MQPRWVALLLMVGDGGVWCCIVALLCVVLPLLHSALPLSHSPLQKLTAPCFLPLPADTLHQNLQEVKDLFEIKRFALFDQVGAGCWVLGVRVDRCRLPG